MAEGTTSVNDLKLNEVIASKELMIRFVKWTHGDSYFDNVTFKYDAWFRGTTHNGDMEVSSKSPEDIDVALLPPVCMDMAYPASPRTGCPYIVDLDFLNVRVDAKRGGSNYHGSTGWSGEELRAKILQAESEGLHHFDKTLDCGPIGTTHESPMITAHVFRVSWVS